MYRFYFVPKTARHHLNDFSILQTERSLDVHHKNHTRTILFYLFCFSKKIISIKTKTRYNFYITGNGKVPMIVCCIYL